MELTRPVSKRREAVLARVTAARREDALAAARRLNEEARAKGLVVRRLETPGALLAWAHEEPLAAAGAPPRERRRLAVRAAG